MGPMKTHGIMPLDRNPKGRDKWIRESKLPNGGLTCGMKGQVLLTKFSQLVWGEEKGDRNEGEEEEEARERESTFSLDFLVICSSNLDETRSKVGLRSKGYTGVPVLWIFENS